MNSYLKTLSLSAVFIMLFAGNLLAQTKVVLSPGSELKVEGGSTLHDWHMATSSAKGEGVFTIEGGQFKGASSLVLSFVAETLKSGTSGLDKNAYKSLKTEQYKDIKFTLKSLSGSGTSFTATGDLSIAGATKSVSFPVKLSGTAGKYHFEGSLKTKLTFFNITPPTALMGTVKTDDEITLSFKTTFQSL
ncbi:YceI family protein [Algoriphagus sanaruensis]|uniref:Lipid/polyisoprenoid-binding YceI-like domain-containing protein n=1 Tax=Algoriphagus sanaruensis TaxID=1727163 RepID=A0A142ERY8_9BACT|nr:YceI family protein [Algoriphagus sanaruensis]AMQ57893.1 hypothetical protein AO498_15675 [Algoriphagus sanaruensis]